MEVKKLKTTNLELTEAIENYTREKIGMLEKFLKNIELPQSARIEIGKTSDHHKKGKIFFAEVNLELPHRMLRASVDAEDLYEAIDRVKEALEREILRYTGAFKDTRRAAEGTAKRLKNLSPLALSIEELPKRKKK
jgi:ribosomal subunit interface protein